MNPVTRTIEIITSEIKVYEQSLKESVARHAWEIGKRLNEAKDVIQHGQFSSWLDENFEFSNRYAREFMRFHDQNRNLSSVFDGLDWSKIRQVLSLPDSVNRNEFIQQPHIVPSTQEEKTIKEMTIKELREVRKSLKEAELRAAQAEATAAAEANSARHYEKLWQQAKNQPPKVETKTIEVVPDHVQHELQRSKSKIEGLERQLEQTKKQLESTEALKKSFEKDSKEYGDLKAKINFLQREKSDLHRQLESATALSGLAVEIDNFLKTKLAPVRYSRALERLDSDVAVRNLSDIISSVENWCDDMRRYLPNGNRIIVKEAHYDDVG